MPTYDATRFEPPAPVALVTLRRADQEATWADVPMLLDTGADVTLVPKSVIERLSLESEPNLRYEVESFDGNRSIVQVVHLELVFLRRTFKGQFLLVDQEWGIIGRNILNRVPITLNGPTLSWDESKHK